ncbi:MAG: hypothetical protein IPP17_23670 [Bacteroidetes bacterium]|nr:hypothetical protein [Bacteroidota bacterium]
MHPPISSRATPPRAITSGAKVTIGQDAVDKYIANILDESKQKERVEENGQMFKRGTRTLHINAF